MRPTYVIAGGYTAGHITPGLALAEHLRERRPDLDVLFMGVADSLEHELVRRAGVPFVGGQASPWVGQSAAGRIRLVAALGPAVLSSRRQLRAVRAVGLASLGSFAAVAPGLAAVSLGLPVTVYEPNAELGLANRLLLPFAHQLLVSRLFSPARPGRTPPAVVGVPLRSAMQALALRPALPPNGTVRVLVLGGSLGDQFLNTRLPALIPRLHRPGRAILLTHQCGHDTDPATVRAAYAAHGVPAVVERFIDPLAPVLAGAHFVITAAGAITLHEIAAAGVPSLVVPLSAAAAAHQQANTTAFNAAAGCLHCTEKDWTDAGVAGVIDAVLTDPARWLDHSRRLRAFSPPDSAAHFLNLLPV